MLCGNAAEHIQAVMPFENRVVEHQMPPKLQSNQSREKPFQVPDGKPETIAVITQMQHHAFASTCETNQSGLNNMLGPAKFPSYHALRTELCAALIAAR